MNKVTMSSGLFSLHVHFIENWKAWWSLMVRNTCNCIFLSRNFILTPLKFIAKIKPLQKNVVLQCSKKPQWLPYTKWLFTYPVLSKHWSKSICVFLPTSVKVDRSVMSILNDLYMYTVKLFHLKYKLHM